jgi:O-antigen ligase
MSSTALASARTLAERTAQWAAIALGFSIPISTALDNVLLVLVLAGWILAGKYRETLDFVRQSRTTLAALVLYGLLLAGSLYGERNAGDAAQILNKYTDLLFIPLFAVLLRDATSRRLALHGFAASLVLVLALSCLVAAGASFPRWLILGTPENPVAFKQYLTQSILLAFGAFLFIQLASASSTTARRAFWIAATLLAVANLLLMTQGRTGHLVLAALALYAAFEWRRWRGFLIATIAMAATVAVLIHLPGPFQERYGLATGANASSKASTEAQESNKQRLDFYRASLAIINEHPIIGVGTGGFPRAYAEKTRGTDAFQTRSPHNEYLHIAVQLGMVGLAALLWLFLQHWIESARIATPLERRLSRGLLLTIALGCLFNSLLLDHTEGLLYAWLTGALFGGLQSNE